MNNQLHDLYGWTGAQDRVTEAKARLRAGIPSHSATGAVPLHVDTGPRWIMQAPSLGRLGDVAAAIKGQPIWRTDDSRILAAASQAESVLRAYEIHGREFLSLLHGSFALSLFDSESGTTLLAVDRMGIERLTYCLRGRDLTFGTSAEFVVRSCGGEPSIRAQSLLSYLFFHMIPSPETVFDSVRKLPPATAVLCKDDTLLEYRYWQPNFAASTAASSGFGELKESLHSALRTAIAAAHANERSGAFLSGGLDSSTVAGYLSRTCSRPVSTFSMGFGFDEYDELRYARIANRHFGCEAHEYQIRPEDIIDQFARIAAKYDEPFGNASALPTLCCASLALSNGVDHLLAGDGGDELFAGNKQYAEQLLFEHYQRIPRTFRQRVLEPALASMPPAMRIGPMRKARNYVTQANTPLPGRLQSWNFLNRIGFTNILHPEFAAEVDLSGPDLHMQSVYAAASSDVYLPRMLQYDWRLILADNDLRKVGSMCDLAGIRVSYPMLHPDVIDVSTRVPPGLMMRGGQLRYFYKQAMADFLPREIIEKRKHGFGLPFGLWLQRSAQLAEFINSNLAGLRKRRIVRADFIEQLIRLHREDDAGYYGVLVWTLAMLEQWFCEHRLAPG